MSDKMNKQTSDRPGNGAGAQEKWEANQNKLHMIPKLKGFDQGVGPRSKSTKND